MAKIMHISGKLETILLKLKGLRVEDGGVENYTYRVETWNLTAWED